MCKYMKLLQGKFPYTHAEVYAVKPQLQVETKNPDYVSWHEIYQQAVTFPFTVHLQNGKFE